MFLPLLSRQALVDLHFLQTRSPDQVLVKDSRHLRQCRSFFCGGRRSFSGFLLWTALDIIKSLALLAPLGTAVSVTKVTKITREARA